MRRTFQYRLYPNKRQEQPLLFWLRRCCALYNACLEESKAAWTMQGKSLSAFDQINELPDLQQAFPAYQELPSHVLRDVIRRHFKAKQAFFRRVAAGSKPGYPRYKTAARYRSLTFPDQAGWKLEAKHLVLTEPGRMRLKLKVPVDRWYWWTPEIPVSGAAAVANSFPKRGMSVFIGVRSAVWCSTAITTPPFVFSRTGRVLRPPSRAW